MPKQIDPRGNLPANLVDVLRGQQRDLNEQRRPVPPPTDDLPWFCITAVSEVFSDDSHGG